MNAHVVQGLRIKINPVHVRPDFLIILQKQYIKLHLWLVISIHPHSRRWNEKKSNKNDLSLLLADKLFLLKIHSLSDLQDCLQHSGHLIHNRDGFVCNKLEQTKTLINGSTALWLSITDISKRACGFYAVTKLYITVSYVRGLLLDKIYTVMW